MYTWAVIHLLCLSLLSHVLIALIVGVFSDEDFACGSNACGQSRTMALMFSIVSTNFTVPTCIGEIDWP
jgi:hypothetical protein